LNSDLRTLIIDRIIKEGGDSITGYIPCSFSKLANEICVSLNTVISVWRKYCEENQIAARPKGGVMRAKLQQDDLELIELLKIESPSISLCEIVETLIQFGGEQTSMSAVSRAIKQRLPSGEQYSRKKITKIARERFTQQNLFYIQLFINYLSSKDPRRLKFFDEAGVKLPDVGTRMYGHSAKGTRCVEVVRKLESPKTTLNMLVSLNGPEYYNLVPGATNTTYFLGFFEEAGEAVNIQTGRPCLEVGDIVIMDNLSSHHYEGGEVLEEWFETMGIELLYTPSYSPDLNPIELCFNKVKTVLNGELRELVHSNTKLAIMEAVETINSQDMVGFYEATSYLFV
jgi:transposase